jgi:hypothetical protein
MFDLLNGELAEVTKIILQNFLDLEDDIVRTLVQLVRHGWGRRSNCLE